MILGFSFIYLALAAALFSAFYYFKYSTEQNAVKSKHKRQQRAGQSSLYMARKAYYVMAAFVGLASVYLWYLIFSHQFQVDYVYRYSSRELGLGYLISSFWAGQEGSFLFWALMLGVMGLFFMRAARQFEGWSMVWLNIVQAAFLVLLIKASPFATLAQTPPDGLGLNPLLQNPWMVIHPPILFLGYAAVTLPFVIGIAALQLRDFDHWVKIAFPWTLFASVTLGAGIIIGGFWAYEVLGWGGYWGWDPVENSSLIAWLAVLALFHSMIITRRNGALQKTSLFLAVVAFVLVIYATYLTRSGVLADFSVHSFQDLGINGFMIIYQLVAFVFGLALIYQRRDEMGYVRIDFSGPTKENALLVTVALLSVSAFLTLIGTSSPILSGLLGKPAQVQIDFYNRVNLPVAILMAGLLGIAPFLTWRSDSLRSISGRLAISAAAAIVATAIALWAGLKGGLLILFLALAVFGLSSNLIVALQRFPRGWKNLAAPVSHVGLGLMFAGIVVSGFFSTRQRVVLTRGQQAEVLGVSMNYRQDYSSPDGKDGMIIDVRDQGDTYEARPRLYFNDYTRSEMREPDVRTGLFSDLYISPLQKQQQQAEQPANQLILKKGESKSMAGYDVKFTDFDMANHQTQQAVKIGARLLLSKDGKEYAATPAVILAQGKSQAVPAELELDIPGKITISLDNINADEKNILLSFRGLNVEEAQPAPPAPAQLLVEVSRKPFMNMLWLGTILLTLGTIIGVKRRSEELILE